MAKRRLRVLIVSSEVTPFSKTGGLADVSNALSKALVQRGSEVRVISPLYRMVRDRGVGMFRCAEDIDIDLGTRTVLGHIAMADRFTDFSAVFVENDRFFDRDGLYGQNDKDFEDNAARFSFFAKMVIKYCHEFEWVPDIIHCHDWQTGLIPALLSNVYDQDPLFKQTATVFTIHNLGYQGLFSYQDLELTGLPKETFHLDGLEYYGKVSLLKAGIVYSQMLNTVSRRYAEEIKTEEYGCGMHGILSKRADSLNGILNGVDYSEWSPGTDAYIKSNYTRSKMAGKRRCKADLLAELGLPESLVRKPLLGMVSRLVHQKGVDVLAGVGDDLAAMGCGMVVLGTGEERFERKFRALAKRNPDSIAVRIGFDEPLAHRIEAGADFFLMPSRYEPCGLNQMYSLRYGTIPIVRATGGLDDTITEYDPGSLTGNGFKFSDCSGAALLEAVKRGTAYYRKRIHWKQLIDNAMSVDFGWQGAAKEYEKLYRHALKVRTV